MAYSRPKRKKRKGNYSTEGQRVDTTYSDGRTVTEQWLYLFEMNEKAFDAGRYHEVMLDFEICEAMHRAFPDRRKPTEERLRKVRSLLSDPPGVPGGIILCKFILDLKGNVCRCTPKGRVLETGGNRIPPVPTIRVPLAFRTENF